MAVLSKRVSKRALRLLAVFALAAAGAGVFAGTALANTVTISGSMEGALHISPGNWISAGYDFTTPGNHEPTQQVTFANATVTITGSCSNGGTQTIVIPLSGGPYTVPAGDGGDWFPSGDQSSPLVYQGSVHPTICGGTGTLDASAGATFTADVQSTDTAASNKLNIRFHYAGGSTNCSSGGCSTSWSGTSSVQPPDVLVPLATLGGVLLAALLAGGLVLRQRRIRRRQATLLGGA